MLSNKSWLLNSLSLSFILTSTLILSACGGDSSNSSTSDITEKTPETPETPETSTDIVAPTISNLTPNSNVVTSSRKVIISGQAIDETALKSVVISNGETSINATLIKDTFTATIKANAGKNTYSVIATDTSGNETTSEESFYFGSQASAGGAHSGIIQDERIYAWGRNNKGQSGIGAITKLNDDPATALAVHPIIPTLISAPSDIINTESGIHEEIKFVSLAFNQNASSALDVNGQVWSWGDGDDGQLGLGIADDDLVDETNHTTPQKIKGLVNIVAINRGYDHMLLLKSDGTVLAFGDNSNGQLGDGSNQDQDTPVAVAGLTNIVQVSAAVGSYAIDEEGRLWAWGKNNYGQLANGVTDSDVHNTPIEINIDEPIVSIASGKGHTLALTASGKVYAWGLNASSQVGMRPQDIDAESEVWDRDILTPKLLPWFDDVIAIWANGNQSFAQRRDGKIYPWGQNMLGTLGIEVDGNVIEPISPILELENVTDLGNGALHTIAIRSDESVFAWGWSFEGSLGGGESILDRWAYRLPLLVSVPEN